MIHVKFSAAAASLALLIAVSASRSVEAQGRRGSNNGAAQMQQMRMQQIAMAQQQLAQGQQELAAAETAIGKAKDNVSSATASIDEAKKTISEARSSTSESKKSLKALEAEILTAQAENSQYARASAAFQNAQEEFKAAKEKVLGSDAYLAQKAMLLKEDGHAAKVAKFERETLAGDAAYQQALDQGKSAKLVYDQVRDELFKGNADWVAATAAARQASTEQSKANAEATKGAVKKLPAMRSLREAEAAAENARANIAQATAILKQYNALPQAQGRKKR